MPGLSTADLSDMRTLVKDWADRTNISDSVIDDFINIAVQRANRSTRISEVVTVSDITLVSQKVPIPSDFLEVKSMTVSSGGVTYSLEPASIHYVEWENSSRSGIPCAFARKNTEFILAPAPADISQVTLFYYPELATLSDDSDTNWYITNATTTILYGALSELSTYTSDEQEAAVWNSKFEAAINELQAVYDRQEWYGDTPSVVL